MTGEEVKRCFNRLVSLYPDWRAKMNDAQVEEWTNALQPFTHFDVMRAIEQHYRNPKYGRTPNLGGLMALLQNKAFDRRRADGSARRESFADLIRFTWGSIASGKSDFELVLRWYRQQWKRCSRSDGYRRKVLRECESSLVQTGMAAEYAGRCARCITEPANIFELALEDVKDHPIPANTDPADDEDPAEWISRKSGLDGRYGDGDRVNAVVSHYASAWAGVRSTTGEGDAARYDLRVLILSHCRRALEKFGMDPADVEAFARGAVELREGEKLRRVPLLKTPERPNILMPGLERQRLADAIYADHHATEAAAV